jgi:multiple sugar transport system permease protein
MIVGRKRIKRTILYIVLIVVFAFWAVPMLWMVSSSFKNDVDSLSKVPKIFFTPTMANYHDALVTRGILKNFVNSVVIALLSSCLGIIIGTPCAYAISRFDMKQKESLYFWFLTTRIAPPILSALPFFLFSRLVGLYDSRAMMVIVYTLMNLSWVVWMMRSFFDELPKEVDESGMVDGCTRVGVLVRLVLPLSRPGLIATAIFCLVISWNEYFFALILTSVKAQTLPAAITSFLTIHGLLWGQMCAIGTIVMLPILVFIFFTQRQLVRGLTMGSVKA